MCFKLLVDHFNKHIDCLGIIDIILHLISVHPFKTVQIRLYTILIIQVFLQQCGVSKLLERLHQISVNYFGKQSVSLYCSKGPTNNQNEETEDPNETSGEEKDEKEDLDAQLTERVDDLELPVGR